MALNFMYMRWRLWRFGFGNDPEAGVTILSSDRPIVQKMAWHQERCTRNCWLFCLRQA